MFDALIYVEDHDGTTHHDNYDNHHNDDDGTANDNDCRRVRLAEFDDTSSHEANWEE